MSAPTHWVPRGPKRYAHQTEALRRMIETRGVCALLMDPGTGKTMSTIDYLSLLALKNGAETRVLVLAPLAAVDTWVDQTADYAAHGVAVWAEALGGSIVQKAEAITARGPAPARPGRGKGGGRSVGQRRALALRVHHADGSPAARRGGPDALRGDRRLILLSCTLDSLSQRRAVTPGGSVTTTDRMVRAVARFQPDVIVVDESHRIKGDSSNVSRAVARLRDHAPRRLILTGTVMPHSPLDVWAQWRFLRPEAFRWLVKGSWQPMPFGAFQERYAQMGGWMGKQVVGFQRLDEMRKIMAQNSITVRKKDALDLPPTADVPVPVNLSARERSAYEQMKATLAVTLAGGVSASVPNRLAQAMRLRQITSGFLVDDQTGTVTDLGSSKVRTALSLIHDTLVGEKRVVVFCHFRREVQAVAAGIKGAEVQVITGETKPQERERLRKRFGSDAPERMVMVAQMRTMSLAVNELVTATHALFLSVSERRDDWVQARDRLDRLGQTGESVTFWNLTAPGTVDEAILTAHRDRTSVEDAVLRHLRAKPADDDNEQGDD